MANEEHIKILKQGAPAWYRWRKDNPDVRVDLRRADLSGVNLRFAALDGVDLRGANLSRTDLRGADLRSAELLAEARFGNNLGLTEAEKQDLQSKGAIFEDIPQ